METPVLKRLLFIAWGLIAVVAFVAAAFSGYSPFGDGVQERDIYSRGGGPQHK